MSSQPPNVLKEAANGVIDMKGRFFPYAVASFTASGTLPAKIGIAYYIREIVLNSNNTAAAAGLVDKVEGIINAVVATLAKVTVATTFAASQESVAVDMQPRVLCDHNTVVTITLATVTPSCTIYYCAVDETEGEYSQ